ncbi:DNA mismatch repair protein Mlh3-like isoform X2 [Daphnia carinata]|uniref:DNA mismatch repair protein Mlh3-like isoform X2 n=1 Tax=Daphnia carinata TaxID=120202 RepID=UPI00257A72AE|nr:DNA mismatch repair protein Mlh3-like isoform X2 [Daphnia carinata]
MYELASAQKCVEELILHSIQENATCIAVRVDWANQFLQVVNNGKGTVLTEIHQLCSRLQLRNKVEEFIASNHLEEALYVIGQNCMSIDIEGQSKNSSSSYKRCYRKGVWSNVERVGNRSTSGTTMSVYDFCLSEPEEETNTSLFCLSLEKLIASFFLLHPNISFSLRFDSSKPPLLQTKKEKNTILATQQLFQLKSCESILPFRGLSCHFKIKGLLVPDMDKHYWFMFVNSRLVESSEVLNFITSVLFSVSSSTGQQFSVVLNIKCSRAAYKYAISSEGERNVIFSHSNELLSLIRSSLDRFISRAPLKKAALVTSWLATAYNKDLISSSLLSTDDLKSNEQRQTKKNLITPGISSPLSCETNNLPPAHYYGKITNSLPVVSHATEDIEMRIKQSPHFLQSFPSSSLLSPNHLTRLWEEDEQMAVNEIQPPCDKTSNGSPFNTESKDNEIQEKSRERLDLKRRQLSTDDGSHFSPKRRFTIGQFWVQPKLPPNIAAANLNRLLATALQRQCKFTKDVMSNIRVINQVDQKFICCVTQEGDKRYLVLVDQHAAHERICLERLMQMHSTKNEDGYVQVQSSPIQPHLSMSFYSQDLEMIQKLSVEFTRYGLHMQFSDSSVVVTRVPACFLAREINEIQRKRNSLYKDLVMALIEETISEYTKNGRLSTCILPVQIRNVLNSLACHGAIKFGDELSLLQCTQLVRALGQCDVPFQCAHGRPLLAPLLELGELNPLVPFEMTPNVVRPKYARLRDYNLSLL